MQPGAVLFKTTLPSANSAVFSKTFIERLYTIKPNVYAEREKHMANYPLPEGFHTLTPYLFYKDAAKAIDFYKRAFGASELLRMNRPDGSIMHAEIVIGNSPVMLTTETDNFPQFGSVEARGGTTTQFFLYVDDCDAWIARALDAGAELIEAIAMQNEGDRRGGVRDPFGITWWIASNVRSKSRAQMQREYDEALKQG